MGESVPNEGYSGRGIDMGVVKQTEVGDMVTYNEVYDSGVHSQYKCPVLYQPIFPDNIQVKIITELDIEFTTEPYYEGLKAALTRVGRGSFFIELFLQEENIWT